MAAPKTVYQLPQSHNSVAPRHGVVTLFGYGIQVRVNRGHLLLADRVGSDHRQFRLARVGHGLKRLIIIGSDGFVSLAALRWLADQDAAFVMLDRLGKVLTVTGPVNLSDARLRRAQALAHQSGAAVQIARELISQKLAGQQLLVRDKLRDPVIADAISRLRAELPAADNIEAIRSLEAQAANAYWSAWRSLPITFPRADLHRTSEHWRVFAARKSPLTGSPRLATNPANAILNYLYSLLESESRLAAAACGLDPGLGVLHVDTPNRDSLACDLQEAVRPKVDAFVLDWLMREPLRRSDFFEERNGNCRLMGSFASRLGQTALTWGRFVAPYAEYVVRILWAAKPERKLGPATRLTQSHRREARGEPSLVPEATPRRPDSICRECGVEIRKGKSHCSKCTIKITRHNFRLGREMAKSPESLARRSNTQHQHQIGIRNWKPSSQPVWLTADVYTKQIQPALATVQHSRIAKTLGVSEPYSADIQRGKRIPHPRHWQALAQLIGVSPDA